MNVTQRFFFQIGRCDINLIRNSLKCILRYLKHLLCMDRSVTHIDNDLITLSVGIFIISDLL